MATPSCDNIRNVAVLGHSHDGKTTLCEALLHVAGATQRLGSTDQRTSILDADPEEQRRGISITAAIAHCDWRDVRVNLIDTPGYPDFAGQVVEALQAADSTALVVAATGQVSVGAEFAWERISAAALPTLVVVTKMDKENATFRTTLEALQETIGRRIVPAVLPIGAAEGFSGYVDLVAQRAFRFEPQGKVAEIPVPAEMVGEVDQARTALVECAAEADDALLERYLEGGELADHEVRAALRSAVLRGDVLCAVPAAGLDERGAPAVLDAIVALLAAPRDRSWRAFDPSGKEVEVRCDPDGKLVAHVFKTTVDSFGKTSYFKVLRGRVRPDTHPFNADKGQEERLATFGQPMGNKLVPATEVLAGDIGAVTKLAVTTTGDTLCAKDAPVRMPPIPYPPPAYSMAIGAKSKGDEDKISVALQRQSEEDPTFTVERDPVTNEFIAHGLGDTHLEVTVERIKRKFGVEAVLSLPRVPYRETITTSARAQHRYKKQSGGAGLYGDCTLEIEPLPRGAGYEWEDRIFGGAIPQQFRSSVEKGVKQTMEQGVIAGFPVVDVRVRLVDGSTHPVDGKDIAFQLAGAMAMRKAVLEAKPIILEPIMNVRVVVPERLLGDVIGIINGHRGRVVGTNPVDSGRVEISAQVPQAEMFTFPIDLRATTQGRGRYTMEFSHYEELPPNLAQSLIEAYRKEHAAAAS